MDAKQYLKQAYRLNELIKSNQEELELFNLTKVSVPSIDYSIDKIQSSRSSNDAEYVNVILKTTDLENNINKDINRCVELQNEIRNVINNVIDVDERLLLRLRYINFYSWEEIRDKLDVSIRTVHKLHAKALLGVKVPDTSEF